MLLVIKYSLLMSQVAEAVLLFIGLQHDRLSRTSLKQLKPQLSISIAPGELEGSARTLCHIRGVRLAALATAGN